MLKHYSPYFPDQVDTYCEPFFGGGAMFIYVMNRYSPSRCVINDINDDIVRVYLSVKNHYDGFLQTVESLERKYIPLSKEDRKTYYYEVRDEHAWRYQNWSPHEEAGYLYFLMKTGFNGIYQLNHNTNGRYGTPAGLLNQKNKVFDRDVLKWWHDALQNTSIMCGDWTNAVTDLPDSTFYFFDPPYRDSFADYGNSFNDHDLLELVNFADTRENVMLSNRDDDGWFAQQRHSLDIKHFDITYTAGRRKKTADGYEAKKAREILLYKTKRNELF